MDSQHVDIHDPDHVEAMFDNYTNTYLDADGKLLVDRQQVQNLFSDYNPEIPNKKLDDMIDSLRVIDYDSIQLAHQEVRETLLRVAQERPDIDLKIYYNYGVVDENTGAYNYYEIPNDKLIPFLNLVQNLEFKLQN